jgi:hypothetical protein
MEIRVNAEDVLAVVRNRFPREYEIAAQQVYIAMLEEQAHTHDEESDGGADA